jgi:hypothetical protein
MNQVWSYSYLDYRRHHTVKADHLKRLMSRLHDFQYAAMDDDHQQEQQEEYSRSEESWLAVSSGSSNGI